MRVSQPAGMLALKGMSGSCVLMCWWTGADGANSTVRMGMMSNAPMFGFFQVRALLDSGLFGSHASTALHTHIGKEARACNGASRSSRVFCAAECTCRAPSAYVLYHVNLAFVAIVATHLSTVDSGRGLQF